MAYFAIVNVSAATEQQVVDSSVATPDNAAVFLYDASEQLVSQGSAPLAADGSASVRLDNIASLGDYHATIAYRSGATVVSKMDNVSVLARSAVPVPSGMQIVNP